MTDQSTWPAHLRDNAPSQQCGRCGRNTWSPAEFGAECRLPQPDGFPCGGRFEPPGILLDIYTARYGEPVPTDSTTPLHNAYVRTGKGKVRITRPEPRDIGDLLTRTVAGAPQLLITWEERATRWQAPDSAHHSLPMTVIVGEGTTPDGQTVRMVAHRAGREEDEQHLGVVTTTIDLYSTEPDGHHVTWYYADPLPDVVAKWYYAGRDSSGEIA